MSYFLCMKIRRKKVKVARAKSTPKKESSARATFLVPSKGKALNKTGDRRGMHMAEKPPSSARMKQIRKMRRFDNPMLPKQQCNNCSFSSQCPQFRANYVCAFLPFLKAHKIESIKDLLFYCKELVAANMQRTHLALIMEKMTGGMPSQEISEQLQLSFDQLLNLHQRMTDSKISAEISMDENGSVVKRIFGPIDEMSKALARVKSRPIDVTSIVDQRAEQDEKLALTAPEDEVVDAELVSMYGDSHKTSDEAIAALA